MPPRLVAPHLQTYEKIFQTPTSEPPLEWREVRALFREMGKVNWEANGDLKVTRNGHVLILRPPPTRDVSGPDELLELRRFLERSADNLSSPNTNGVAQPAPPAAKSAG